MVQAMDQEAVEGDIWMRKLLKERWMVQAMDHEDIDGASDGRSNGWYKRWITKQSKEIWIRKLKERLMVQAMEGAMDGTSDGSRSSRRRYGSGSCRRSDHDAVEASIDVTGRKHMMMIG